MSTSGSTGSVSSLQLRRLLRVYSDGLRADPENLELRLKLAEVLRLLGRNTEAVALYGSVAWAFAIVGNLAQSIRLCKLILDVSPAHTETQRMLATLYASKEIRDKKQAVPVKKVAGRWVADPRHTESPKVAPETDRFSSVAGEAATDGPALERPATLVTAVEGPFARSTVPGKGLRKKRDTPERPLEKRERPREQEREDVPPPDGPAVATVDPRLLVTESDSPRDDSIGLLPTVDARFDPTDRDAGPPDTVAEIRAGFATTHPSTPPPTVDEEPKFKENHTRRHDGARLDAGEYTPRPSSDESPAPFKARNTRGYAAAGKREGARWDRRGPGPLLEPDGRVEEELSDGRKPRSARSTAQMDATALSTMLRLDAEIAYREAQPTDCYAAIQRVVLEQAEGQQASDESDDEQDATLLDEVQELAARELEASGDPAPQLPRIPLFSELDESAFVALVERLETRFFPAGDIVLEEGEPGDSLLLVSAGQLEVFKEQDGEAIQLALLGPGAFVGEFGLLTDRRRHASVRACVDTEMLELRRDVLADLIRDHPQVQQTLQTFYQHRVLKTVLATSPLFRAVTPAERELVIGQFTTARFVQGEVIVREGDTCEAFFVVMVGHCDVSCLDSQGEAVRVGHLQEGDYFGEMSLISGYPAEATVCATQVTEVLRLESRTFYELASVHPEIWAEVQKGSQDRADRNDEILAGREAPLI